MTSADDQAVHAEVFDALSSHIAAAIPGFEVRYKEEHVGQRILGVLLRPFIKGYATRYTTTLYPRVYYATRHEVERYPRTAWETLAHEYVHLHDQARSRLGFPLGYVAPQILAVFAFGAIGALWTPWALLSLLALIALAPWPSPGRRAAELRGYAMDVAIQFWTDGNTKCVRYIKPHFTGWAYYRMWPDAAAVDRAFADVVRSLHATGMPFDSAVEPFREVRDLLDKRGLLASPSLSGEGPGE